MAPKKEPLLIRQAWLQVLSSYSFLVNNNNYKSRCVVFSSFNFGYICTNLKTHKKDLDKTLFSKSEKSLICVIRSIMNKLTQYMKSFRLKRKKFQWIKTYFWISEVADLFYSNLGTSSSWVLGFFGFSSPLILRIRLINFERHAWKSIN